MHFKSVAPFRFTWHGSTQEGHAKWRAMINCQLHHMISTLSSMPYMYACNDMLTVYLLSSLPSPWTASAWSMRAPSLLPAMPSLTVLLLGFGLALEEVTTSLRKAHQLAIVTLLSGLPCLLPWFFPLRVWAVSSCCCCGYCAWCSLLLVCGRYFPSWNVLKCMAIIVGFVFLCFCCTPSCRAAGTGTMRCRIQVWYVKIMLQDWEFADFSSSYLYHISLNNPCHNLGLYNYLRCRLEHLPWWLSDRACKLGSIASCSRIYWNLQDLQMTQSLKCPMVNNNTNKQNNKPNCSCLLLLRL